MSAQDLRIAAFPQGPGFWRVDWFGPIAFPNRMLRTTQPSVLVHLSRILAADFASNPSVLLAPGSTSPYVEQAKRWVSIGTTVLLRTGDVWSNQMFVTSPDDELETFSEVQIDANTSSIVKAGTSDEAENFLLPMGQHPWHSGSVLGQPVLHRLAVMHAQVVQDQEHLAAGVLHQRLEEVDEALVVEGPVDDHPARLALVGDAGDHGQLLAHAAHGHRHRRLALGRKAAATRIGVDQRRLVIALFRFAEPLLYLAFAFA